MIPCQFLYVFALFLCAAASAFAQDAATSPLDQQIVLLELELADTLKSKVDPAFTARIQDLGTKYSSALERALDAATKAGQLDEALTIREEKRRFDQELTVPETASPTGPATLTQLRHAYLTQMQKIKAERELAAAPFFAAYDARLAEIQEKLTKEGKLDDAVKVKKTRANAGKSASPLASGPAPGETEEGWQVIFDGHSLNLWKPTVSSRNFQIKDGALLAIRVTEEADYLFFKGSPQVPEKLKNFELRARVRADAEANSGFYFHLHGKAAGRGGHPASGVEVSLQNGAKPAKFPTGSLYYLTPMEAAPLNQADWFDIHFKVIGPIVTVTINGKPYLEHLVAESAGEDQKGIQAEGGLLAIQANSKDGGYYFQRIEIKPLP